MWVLRIRLRSSGFTATPFLLSRFASPELSILAKCPPVPSSSQEEPSPFGWAYPSCLSSEGLCSWRPLCLLCPLAALL